MTDVFGRRRHSNDLGRHMNTAVIVAQVAAAADQLEAAYRQIDPALNTLHKAHTGQQDRREERSGEHANRCD